ncbi:hypothetical protein [Marinobacter sp. C2H3]|uniref:hypothetical protein n=1 Tax=Marinobacter sp. C2H3 TaxID=3119003 RepID=UPI00300F27B0
MARAQGFCGGRLLAAGLLLGTVAPGVLAQTPPAQTAAKTNGTAEGVTALNGSASVFTAVTHTRTSAAGGTESNTEPSIGVSGDIGGSWQRGASRLDLRYGGSLETTRDRPTGGQTDNSSVTGLSRFNYLDPANPVDFNLGHSIESVRNSTGFVINPSSYDTRQTVTGGAGLRLRPGDLTTLRLSAQAGHSYGGGAVNAGDSVTASAELARRLDERSTGSLVASRSWSNEDQLDITIDSAQLIYDRLLDAGRFRIGAGVSQADTQYPNASDTTSDAVTGFAERSWTGDGFQTSVSFNRRLSDSVTDISLNLPPIFDFLPDSVRVRDLVISDSILITHNNDNLCDICNVGFGLEGAILKSQLTDTTTHEYTASANLGLQITDLQRLEFAYSWQADAGESAGDMVQQIHRLDSRWVRQLAEYTRFAVEFNQSYLDTTLPVPNERQYVLRLVLTHGFSLMANR